MKKQSVHALTALKVAGLDFMPGMKFAKFHACLVCRNRSVLSRLLLFFGCSDPVALC